VTDDGGLLIVDVWESEQAMGRFAEARLLPTVRQVGRREENARVLPLHNRLRGTADEAAVLIRLEVPDAGADVYDRVTADMPAHAGEGSHPAHEHAVAVDGDTLVVADIWPSTEAAGAFAQEQLGPAAAKHGLRMDAMKQRVARVHNRIRGTP
jgi:hypothetical protein